MYPLAHGSCDAFISDFRLDGDLFQSAEIVSIFNGSFCIDSIW